MQQLKQFLFSNTSNKQTALKNSFWLTVSEVGSRLIKLAVFVYAARALGVTEWGVFSYGLALVGTFSILSDIGMNVILLREVSKRSDAMRRYIATGFFIKAALSLISSLLVLGMLLFIKDHSIRVLIPFISVLLFIDSLREFGYALNRAFEKMEIEAGVKIFSTVLLAGFSAYTLLVHPTAQSLLIAYILSGAIGLVVLYITIRKHFSNIFRSFDRSLIRTILIEAWPIGIIAVFGTILSSIDTIFLGWLKTTTEVGYYAASQKPLQILLLIPTLIATALLPFFSRSAGTNDGAFAGVLGRVLSIALFIIIPLTVLSILCAKPIILILFGPQYYPAISLFQITALSTIASVPSIFISNALLAHGKQKLILLFIGIGALSNVLLSLLLIPLYGMYGAAIAFTVSQIIANTFIVFKTRSLPAFRFSLNRTILINDIKGLFKN